MNRTKWTLFIFAIVVATLSYAPEAHAAFNDDWGGYENDWTVVSDHDFSAGGMSNCVARKYCTDCAEALNGGASYCAKAYRHAYCKCGYIFYQGNRYCISSGACEYKPA